MNAPLSSGRDTPNDYQRRFAGSWGANGAAEMNSPAIGQGRSVFFRQVVEPEDSTRLLVSGQNNRKIGKFVTVGRWKGFPIYTLTLEERATCPKTCHHWKTCYGNTMPRARRHKHGIELEKRLQSELGWMSREHPQGFVVRLHVLGDFYSVEYVEKWRDWLIRFPMLRVFGYTAHPPTSEIGEAVVRLRQEKWDRFAIRNSLPEFAPERAAITFPPENEVPKGAFLCPAQRRDDKCCATCGACWESDRTVAFMEHGKKRNAVDRKPREPRQVGGLMLEHGKTATINGVAFKVNAVEITTKLNESGNSVRIVIEGTT